MQHRADLTELGRVEQYAITIRRSLENVAEALLVAPVLGLRGALASAAGDELDQNGCQLLFELGLFYGAERSAAATAEGAAGTLADAGIASHAVALGSEELFHSRVDHWLDYGAELILVACVHMNLSLALALRNTSRAAGVSATVEVIPFWRQTRSHRTFVSRAFTNTFGDDITIYRILATVNRVAGDAIHITTSYRWR